MKDSQPKHSALKLFMGLLAGSSENLLSSDGTEWATWRRIFNPGFSTSNLTTFVPSIIEETEVFCSTLEKYAKSNRIFRLEEVLTKLSIDVIGQLILLVLFLLENSLC